MPADVHFFGIRHHGPGSARRLLAALDAAQPSEVLIEGPADLTDLMPMLAQTDMVPPIALLAYPTDAPEQASFWPFAVFSPEYQATLWAVAHGVPARFIDLPVSWRLAAKDATEDPILEDDAPPPEPDPIQRDPIGALAQAAGYQDGESWWQHVIEENPDPGPIFAAVSDAMGALRQEVPKVEGVEAAREAHMRLEIAKARKANEGPVAVVCGAWHDPALREKHLAKDDRALLKGAPKRKIAATWTPWTAPRLATGSGYGAGVSAPGWNKHLWETSGADQTTRWVTRIARALRDAGHVTSTASIIETERLSVSLAALRGKPKPGFEELREAAIACLCFGNTLLWRTISDDLLIGSEVGRIPDNVPLAPLLEDLQRQQKKARLKPEALERELALDLRSDAGLFRSTLLHRLSALDVPWGRLDDPGRSRGTFRERWRLKWEPTYAVALVENLAYGPTLEQAASGRLEANMADSPRLGDLSDLVFQAMTAQLPVAAKRGSDLLEDRAAQTSDAEEMLAALAPLADVLRYGKARATDTAQMETLFDRIAIRAALALPYAARDLDEGAASTLRATLRAADQAVRLLDSATVIGPWQDALRHITEDMRANRLISGQGARLLYEADEMTSDAAVTLLGRMLSPGTETAQAAAFFEGFLAGAGTRLIHDAGLRDCVGTWLADLDEETFTESLPLFRRVFSDMDRMERRHLLDAALGAEVIQAGWVESPTADTDWPAHLRAVTAILKGAANG
ncbi:MAG: DUF5682 family protein [Pseudomonadota bacterium]